MSKRKKATLLLSILTVIFATAALSSTIKAADTVLAITPAKTTYYTHSTPVGTTFKLNVTVYDVLDLYTWQINVTYDTSMLNCTAASLPADQVFAGKTYFAPPVVLGNGWVFYGATLLGEPAGVDATEGRLAQLTFEIISAPSTGVFRSSVDFSGIGPETFMQDTPGIDIIFTTESGTYEYWYTEYLVHDIVVGSQTYTVTTLSNGTITPVPMIFEEPPHNRTAFNITGTADAVGFVNITIPNNFMWNSGIWNVTVGGQDVVFTAVANSSHTSLYFTFTFTGTDQLTHIVAPHVIPEFSQALMLAFLMIATLGAVIFASTMRAKRHIHVRS